MRELDYVRVGKRIREARKINGWSQDVLAKKCGISMSFLGHIERGTRIMSLETFTSICTALGANADELLWGVVQPSEGLLGMLRMSEQKADEKNTDSYSMYIKIMKSVAEIMNGSIDSDCSTG